MKEAQLKARLIDYLLQDSNRDPNAVLACEVPFMDGRRRADLVRIGETCTTYEIKSDYDNLDKLGTQLRDYCSCFEEVVVVTTETHINRAKELCPTSVGILLAMPGDFRIIRKPKRRVALKKKALATLITRNDLLKTLALQKGRSYRNAKMDSAKLRMELCKCATLIEIRTTAYQSLYLRTMPRFQSFLKHRGEITHPDDLIMLTDQPDKLIID